MTDSVAKERDFYRAKLEQSQGRIRNLEHDFRTSDKG